MKLIGATFKNFRLLKDLKLDFSIDFDKPLTVIRAANETGKTTCETALIWGLYGSKALPNKGKTYPIYPSDAVVDGKKVEISVEIEFETDQVIPIGRGRQESKTVRYRLRRSCIEFPPTNGDARRETETKVLYEVTPEGVKRVIDSQVEAIIEDSIPEALKDVYFTDGDSAMSFIEAAATQGVKRKRVQNAIEALLGLNVLEKTIKHLDSAARKFASNIDDTDYGKELEGLNDKIQSCEEDISEWEEELNNQENALHEGEKTLNEQKRKIEEILKLGDRKKLADEIKSFESHIVRNQNAAKKSLQQLSGLLNDSDLASSMISQIAIKGRDILTKLHDKKELPKANIPILQELLTRKSCFCGADLDTKTEDGLARRQAIEQKIENSRSADELQEIASALYFSVRSENFDATASEKWIKKYSSFFDDFEKHCTDEKRFQNALKSKKEEIDLINDSQLNELREFEKSLTNKLKNAQVKIGELLALIKETKERKAGYENDRSKIENKLDKKDDSADKLRLSRLAKTVFQNVFDRLRKDEVSSVSREMNRIFLEMIGSDPEANDLTMITKAELTEDFDILVYGPHDHKLNPDQDLNGASRRAITLAFILALTKVSEVKAPNVIDTPLGMMSGYVKQSVVNKMLEEGTQIILFLTHDEIQGIEHILDSKAGLIYTLTNPAHYPRMLVNKPDTEDAAIIRCVCNHRESCDICARKDIKEG